MERNAEFEMLPTDHTVPRPLKVSFETAIQQMTVRQLEYAAILIHQEQRKRERQHENQRG